MHLFACCSLDCSRDGCWGPLVPYNSSRAKGRDSKGRPGAGEKPLFKGNAQTLASVFSWRRRKWGRQEENPLRWILWRRQTENRWMNRCSENRKHMGKESSTPFSQIFFPGEWAAGDSGCQQCWDLQGAAGLSHPKSKCGRQQLTIGVVMAKWKDWLIAWCRYL